MDSSKKICKFPEVLNFNCLFLYLKASSHMSQELWPWIFESPKEIVQRLSQHTSKIMWCGHRSSSVVWSHTWPGPQPDAISMNFYSCGVLTDDKIEWINGCERMECHGLPILCQAYLQVVVFENNPNDHETWSIRCHVGIYVDFTSISHSHTPSVPQA